MSFLSFIPIIGSIIDRIIPDKNAAANAKAKLEMLEQSGELELMLEQIKVNRVEAQHKNIFVSGWRPAIGWVCALVFAYHYFFYPIMVTIAAINGTVLQDLPVFDLSQLMTVLGGMLGLGAFRTFEKYKGISGRDR
jgi:hypothetical protein